MKDSVEFKIFKELILKYRVKLTEEELVALYNSNKSSNLRDSLDYIVHKYNYSMETIMSSEEYKKFILIFKKTRINEFPTLDLFKAIPMELAQKFKLKVFNLFKDSHLFSDPISLINMIGIFGLFENDDEVEKRIHTAIKLFFHQKVFSKRKDIANKSFVEETANTSYTLNEDIKNLIPEELKVYLFPEITSNYYSFLRRMNGNYGRKINDFLIPYKNDDGVLKLKKGVYEYAKRLFPTDFETIKNIKLSDYEELIKCKQLFALFNPYEKVIEHGYSIKKGLSVPECKQALSEFKEYELTYGPSDIQSMFRKSMPIYDPEFYNFLITHQADISVSTNNFSKLSDVQKNYHNLKKYYLARGNPDPDFVTMIEWLRSVPYNVEFGDEEFAIEAKNAGVLKEGYDYYSDLLKKVRTRYKRAIPNHNKCYTFIDKNGREYHIQTQILNGTDPLNLLIGESKYTDCCQKYNDLGQVCLEHASTSNLGGIFVVNLIEDGCKKILCQSWFWVNEQEAVLDNVEQTNILNSSSEKQREIYEDLIAFAIKNAAQDILIDSNNKLLEYVENELLKLKTIDDINLKDSIRKRIHEILTRQSLKVVTVGANYSDIIVADYFPNKALRELYLPKDYKQKGYTDATNRYIAAGSESAITLEPSETFVEENIYRDERQIEVKKLSEINNAILKRIMYIDSFASGETLNFNNLDEFIQHYQLDISNTSIIYGEDWYCLYEDNIKEILKVSVGIPRLEDEIEQQRIEIESILTKTHIKDEKSLCRRRKLEVKL